MCSLWFVFGEGRISKTEEGGAVCCAVLLLPSRWGEPDPSARGAI